VKYRKKLFLKYDSEIKSSISKVSTTKNFVIEKMESDKEYYSKVIMYDDSRANLEDFVKLHSEYPDSKFYAWIVSLDGVASELNRSINK
jgi:hypothetical protein